MTDHEKSVYDGIGMGLGTVGVLGFAINATYWAPLLIMIALAIAVPIIVRMDHNE